MRSSELAGSSPKFCSVFVKTAAMENQWMRNFSHPLCRRAGNYAICSEKAGRRYAQIAALQNQYKECFQAKATTNPMRLIKIITSKTTKHPPLDPHLPYLARFTA